DAAGDLAALEVSHSRCQLRRPAAGEDLLFHSNAYQSPGMFSVQVPRTAHWSRRAPQALRGIRILQSAETRDARFRELLSRQKTFDRDDLARIMADHGPQEAPSDNSICKHSD